jgi:phosphoglycerol geranylgeranyltransferase
MARAVKKVVNLPLIVGGGIRTGEQVKEIAKAGADIVVTGNVLEENSGRHKIRELVDNMKAHKKT